MSEDAFSLDALLDDLDDVVKQSPRAPHTIKFMPHPPRKEKSPTQLNPKNKFAVEQQINHNEPMVQPRFSPTKSYSTNTHDFSIHDVETKPQNSSSTAIFGRQSERKIPSSFDATNSVDDLLDMLASPIPDNATSNNNSNSSAYNNRALPKTGAFSSHNYGNLNSKSDYHLPSTSNYNNSSSSSSGLNDTQIKHKSLPLTHSHSMSTNINNSIQQQQQQHSPVSNFKNHSVTNNDPSSSNNSDTKHISLPRAASTTLSSNNNSNGNNNLSMLNGGQKSHSISAVDYSKSSLPSSQQQQQASPPHKLWAPLGASGSASGNNSGNSSNSATSSTGGNSGTKQRCSRVVIGDAQYTRGLKNSAFSKVCCDNLICLQCNFKIHCFKGQSWDASADYMFLRNNVPNEAKLSAKLNTAPDSCAYCCQCSWTTQGPGDRQLIQGNSSDPQWTCAGH